MQGSLRPILGVLLVIGLLGGGQQLVLVQQDSTSGSELFANSFFSFMVFLTLIL